jgi:hypothetical protein
VNERIGCPEIPAILTAVPTGFRYTQPSWRAALPTKHDVTVAVPGSGGRTWWAHLEFTRINIARIILCKKIEDYPEF